MRVSRRRSLSPRGPGRAATPGAALAVVAIAVLWTIPTFGLFVTSLRPSENSSYTGWWAAIADGTVTLENYQQVLTGGETLPTGIAPYLTNSFVITVPVVVVGLMLACHDLSVAITFSTGSTDVAPVTAYLAVLKGGFGAQEYLLTAGAFVAIVPPLVLFFAMQRYFVRGLLAGSVDK